MGPSAHHLQHPPSRQEPHPRAARRPPARPTLLHHRRRTTSGPARCMVCRPSCTASTALHAASLQATFRFRRWRILPPRRRHRRRRCRATRWAAHTRRRASQPSCTRRRQWCVRAPRVLSLRARRCSSACSRQRSWEPRWAQTRRVRCANTAWRWAIRISARTSTASWRYIALLSLMARRPPSRVLAHPGRSLSAA